MKMTKEWLEKLKDDCSYTADYHLSAAMHPFNSGSFNIEELQKNDDKFRVACRHPKTLNGEAYLFHIDND